MNPPSSAPTPASTFSVDRLASLSDGVFAVAMTLLAYNVSVPHGPFTDAQLRAYLGGLASDLRALCLSFAVAAMFWRGNIKVLEVMRHRGRPRVSLSLVFLLFVVLLPITTGFYGTLGATRTTVSLYVGNLAVLAFTQLGVWLLTLFGLPLGWRAWLRYLVPSLFVSTIFLVATVVSFFRPSDAMLVCIAAFASPLVSRLAWRDERARP